MPTSAQTKATENNAPEFLRQLTPEENGVPTKRFPRTHAGDNEEERAVTIMVPVNVKKLGAKLGRLARYNFWIFSRRNLDWVLKHYPDLFKGYFHFYAKRLM
ncbi:hypothetical protein V7S43_000765 [Phytophthora oleae]|uniref:Uncharacterized protein n=1 Tax=Phytophthora oleae TaxID=2107226 RepID=A0ABD3GCD0_9STRA